MRGGLPRPRMIYGRGGGTGGESERGRGQSTVGNLLGKMDWVAAFEALSVFDLVPSCPEPVGGPSQKACSARYTTNPFDATHGINASRGIDPTAANKELDGVLRTPWNSVAVRFRVMCMAHYAYKLERVRVEARHRRAIGTQAVAVLSESGIRHRAWAINSSSWDREKGSRNWSERSGCPHVQGS